MKMNNTKILLSAVIITYNEERNIERCLKSLEGVADEIVVLDSFSTDRTLEICNKYNVRFFQNPFEGHIEQKNVALSYAQFPCILSLDADEALSEELRNSILDTKKNWTANAYSFPRLTNYCGKWIKHCGWYPDTKLRMAIKEEVSWTGENPHDKLTLKNGGKVIQLKGDLLHYSFYSISDHLMQINKFTDIRAVQMRKKNKNAHWYNLIVSPAFKFFKSYILKLGFLDGFYGYIICKNSAHATFLRYAKLHQLNCNTGRENKL